VTAYAVAERVRAGPVHPFPHEAPPHLPRRFERPVDLAPPGARPELDDPEASDLADWFVGLREQVVISLFSLFDPESWR
jgi:hypothetical protein